MNQKHSSSLLPVYLVLFVDNFAFAIIFAIFGPLFISPDYGFVSASISSTAKNFLLGGALASFPLGQLIGAPFLGGIADRFGRKKTFYITIIGTVIGFLFSGFSILIHNYTLLVLTRLATGFFSGNLSICLASIADVSPDEKTRAKNFSVIILITGISWMTAIISGSYLSNPSLSEYFTPSFPFFISALLSFLSLLSIAYFYKETHPMKEKFHIDLFENLRDIKKALQIKELRLLYVIYMFWILGWGLAFQWYSPFALQAFHTSIIEINWGQSLNGITWIIGGYFLNRFLIKRWHAHSIILIGSALIFFSLFGMALSKSFLFFAFFFVIACLPAAFCWPNILNLISISAPQNVQGKIMGISQSVQSLAFILATIFGSIIAGALLSAMYYLAASLILLSFLILFFRRTKKTATT